jgi:hypothetical protein
MKFGGLKTPQIARRDDGDPGTDVYVESSADWMVEQKFPLSLPTADIANTRERFVPSHHQSSGALTLDHRDVV